MSIKKTRYGQLACVLSMLLITGKTWDKPILVIVQQCVPVVDTAQSRERRKQGEKKEATWA